MLSEKELSLSVRRAWIEMYTAIVAPPILESRSP